MSRFSKLFLGSKLKAGVSATLLVSGAILGGVAVSNTVANHQKTANLAKEEVSLVQSGDVNDFTFKGEDEGSVIQIEEELAKIDHEETKERQEEFKKELAERKAEEEKVQAEQELARQEEEMLIAEAQAESVAQAEVQSGGSSQQSGNVNKGMSVATNTTPSQASNNKSSGGTTTNSNSGTGNSAEREIPHFVEREGEPETIIPEDKDKVDGVEYDMGWEDVMKQPGGYFYTPPKQ